MHWPVQGPTVQDKLHLRMGRVGQPVINCSQRNLFKATVDFKLSPNWLERGHNTVIELSITQEIHLYGDSILQENFGGLWGVVHETWNLEKIGGFKSRKKQGTRKKTEELSVWCNWEWKERDGSGFLKNDPNWEARRIWWEGGRFLDVLIKK